MTIPFIQSTNTFSNPVTGVFGTGQVQFFTSSGSWTVPAGISRCRVRMWGAGANYCASSSYYSGGGGGGFCLKTIYDLSSVSSVAVTVGAGMLYKTTAQAAGYQAGTSSFGAYCSATGGTTGTQTVLGNIGGSGVGGDINTSGGYSYMNGSTANGGGGGCGSLFGNGGNGPQTSNFVAPSGGGAGGGYGYSSPNITYVGGAGFMTLGAVYSGGATPVLVQAQAFPTQSAFSIDFIGVGGGGTVNVGAVNGGGGGYSSNGGGFPGGGTGYSGPSASLSAGGLVIVEW